MTNKNKFAAFFTGLFLVLGISCMMAADVPGLTGRVVDRSGILSVSQKREITDDIIQIEKNTGGQMAVLIVNSIGNNSLEDYSIKVAEKWKIGLKGKDNGVILIIVKNDRKIRLEVGYGWEGFINDARAGDIIRAMAPYFKKGQYAQGIIKAIGYVQAFVKGDKQKQPPKADNDGGGIFLFFVILFLVLGYFNRFRRGHRTYGRRSGGWIFFGGGFGGGSDGGGFSGGGGGFGGGGASGGW